MKKISLILSGVLSLAAGELSAAAIQVSGVQKYVGGITDVITSGGPSNFTNTTTVGSYAVFDMQKDGLDYADLRVTYEADNFGIGSNVLIARTSNSQGLTDAGTVTILIGGSNTNGLGGSFRFDWFAPGSFVGGSLQGGSSLLSAPVLYTTFDIDFKQFVSAPTTQLQYYALNTNTVLHTDTTQTPSLIRFEDSGANSLFDNPTTALQFLTVAGPASHRIDMGKQDASGNALFMFEFRDPSQVLGTSFTPVPVAVPEPASMMMIGLVMAGGFWIRRRFMD